MNLQIPDFLITPIIAALVGLVVWYLQSRIEQIRRAEARLRDERRKVYSDLLDPYIRMMATIDDPKGSAKAVKSVASYEYKKTAFELSLIGSDSVVRAFNTMMQSFYAAEREERVVALEEFFSLWGGLILEIRKSVGDPRTKLKPVDMLRGLIKDVDTLF